MFKKAAQVAGKRRLAQAGAEGFLSEKKTAAHDLIFIRHAQSQFNRACEEYRVRNQIPYLWKALCSHEGFDERVLFNYEFVDTRLTAEGREECRKTREKLDREEVDCVIVSPQARALETYRETLGHRGVPVFADPLFSGPLRSCVDLSRQTAAKKNEFPEVDFQAMEGLEDLWFLDYLTSEQQIAASRRLQLRNPRTFREKCEELLLMLKEQQIFEDAYQYRLRIQQAKYRLAHYQRRYRRIAVVCHYYTIEYMGARDYEDCGMPVFKADIKNCCPYYSRLGDLLSVRERAKAQAYPIAAAQGALMSD